MTSRPAPAPEEIQIVLGSFDFYPLYAGPPLRFLRYAPGLRARGVGMRVLTETVSQAALDRTGAVVDATPTPEGRSINEVIEGIPIRRVALRPSRWKRVRFYRAVAEEALDGSPRAQVVQLLNLNLSAAPAIRRLRRGGVPTVFSATLLGALSDFPAKRMLQRIHRRLPLGLVDVLVVSSRAMKRRFEELGGHSRIEIIPNGVDTERFRPPRDLDEKAALRRKLGLDPGWTVLISVGPVIPRKGADAVIEAFVSIAKEHPQARLIMAGPRYDQARPELKTFGDRLQRALAQLPHPDQVLFTGAIKNVDEYLRCADGLIFPSRREGMPNVPPEAMATGLPAILTPFEGLPEEFGLAGREYILSSWERRRLATDISSLLSSPELRRILGEAGRRHATKALALDRSLDSYAALYRSLACV